MKNVKLNWSPVDPKFQVANYNVYHGKSPDTLAFFTGINQAPITLYPDQLGYEPGDTLYAAVSAINRRGEGVKTQTLSVLLPVVVELELPPPPDNFTIELVD